MSTMNESDIAVYVTVDALYPGTHSDESALRAVLAALSCDETLACARINAIV
jgi:hypothetical protein